MFLCFALKREIDAYGPVAEKLVPPDSDVGKEADPKS
jgi:hypothetical protein